MQAKYDIQDYDFYNFDETGFMMGQVHLSNWYTEIDFPTDWTIKSISNE
ncbi:hypothetical protein SS1G_02144 [Sclerotinia sclerotiorum 1980 UF-70]|uniref:DDE-1 domain-containing protein n=1 Tax=Sclerotinia sclerotiorum (strain ATCC 18683 / 1980 / Ss-1) TaxID=665079 RepID=A7EA14_SCLS1|nr:hypothetical protein SS1G_02144 [Sclerotinia sclerotiorum 1980 UF-70]EDN99292.1 hypothetical protein SS1G_02144 [Sclerotinia sclerotiorum 1980 UF-70]